VLSAKAPVPTRGQGNESPTAHEDAEQHDHWEAVRIPPTLIARDAIARTNHSKLLTSPVAAGRECSQLCLS
jgi:hypothetical protein